MDSADMNNGNDDIDKWPLKWKSKKKTPGTGSSNAVRVIYDRMVDSDEYSMKTPLGKCLIFNHRYFNHAPERKGTENDVQSLHCLFRKLGFRFDEVKIYYDLTISKIQEKLREASQEDHSENSCFICCILTHGNEGSLLARDGMYEVNTLYDIFNGDACPTLRFKPKIFFIQACQGEKTDSGVDVIRESVDNKLKIPTYADFLIAHSTFPGFVSFKNEENGSYFIQMLCNVLNEHAENKHLLDMLVIVTRKIALYFESYNPKNKSVDKKKQIPCITSTLTKNVKFPKTVSDFN